MLTKINFESRLPWFTALRITAFFQTEAVVSQGVNLILIKYSVIKIGSDKGHEVESKYVHLSQMIQHHQPR